MELIVPITFFPSLELVTHRMVKEGATVIDVGISKSWTDKAMMKNKQFVGDVGFEGKRIFTVFDRIESACSYRSETCRWMDHSCAGWRGSRDIGLSDVQSTTSRSTTETLD